MTAQPQDNQLFLCHTGCQKGIVALQNPCFIAPPGHNGSKSQPRPDMASFYHHDMQAFRGAQFFSEPLLLPLLGVAAGGDIRTHG